MFMFAVNYRYFLLRTHPRRYFSFKIAIHMIIFLAPQAF